MRKLLTLTLLLLSTMACAQYIDNKSSLPIQVRIWKNSEIIDQFRLEQGTRRNIPSYNILNPFKEPYLLQFKFLELEHEIPNHIKIKLKFDGEFFNFMIDDEAIRLMGNMKIFLIGIEIRDLVHIPRA